MNTPANKQGASWTEVPLGQDAESLCIRVVDTLLRENVRECISQGVMVESTALPTGLAASFPEGQRWLQIDHLGTSRLWIPVSRCDFMQSWRLTRLPLVRQGPTGYQSLYAIDEILACFRHGLTEQQMSGFIEFEAECRTALEHKRACEAEQGRWFQEWRAATGNAPGADLATWHARLLHYDRLAAFHDHPFYPTARAKLGFSADDLHRYAPEFQPAFELNWLAVPQSMYQQSGEMLPPGWPNFAQLGLDERLAATHTLLPVHPFVWNHQLGNFLHDSGLQGQVVPAPRQALRVTPTLSVRTLLLLDEPAWHVKLPLTIRTLGGRNIRTIKPTTIIDGHRIQSLLGAIVEREAGLRGRVLLTAEDTGAHVANQNFLGFIVRRYPEPLLNDVTMMPVAALCATAPSGHTVIEEVAERFFDGDMIAFLDDYLALTLRLHLLLWIRYGVALESNQQNSVLVLNERTPRIGLLLKDNDAARIDHGALARRWPALAQHVANLQDRRIMVDSELALAQMFTTITLQLNIAALVETVARLRCWKPARLYEIVRRHVEHVLAQLEADGENTAFARRILLEDDHLYIKYLLVAATLVDKRDTGATDVNKYYGRSAPNFLRGAR